MISLKKIFSVFIILVLFLHTNYLGVYFSLYLINNEELTASCCKKIVVNCNAHCYLDKKMNEEGNMSNNGTTAEIKLKITEYVVTENTQDLLPDIKNEIYSYLNPLESDDPIFEIDHPPQT